MGGGGTRLECRGTSAGVGTKKLECKGDHGLIVLVPKGGGGGDNEWASDHFGKSLQNHEAPPLSSPLLVD